MTNVHDDLAAAVDRVIGLMARTHALELELAHMHAATPTAGDTTTMTDSPLTTSPEAVIRAGSLMAAYIAGDEAEATRILASDLGEPDGPLSTMVAVIAISTVLTNALAETGAYEGRSVLDLAVNAVVAQCYVADDNDDTDGDN